MSYNRFFSLVAAACCCGLFLQPSAAQTLYKSIMPDGRVVYGDKPAPGAAKVEATRPDTSKTGSGGAAARDQESLKALEKARLQRDERTDKVQSAEQKLRDAEAALAAGKEPLEGERIGTAGGASRLSEIYFERQRKLEASVETARRELDEVRSGR